MIDLLVTTHSTHFLLVTTTGSTHALPPSDYDSTFLTLYDCVYPGDHLNGQHLDFVLDFVLRRSPRFSRFLKWIEFSPEKSSKIQMICVKKLSAE